MIVSGCALIEKPRTRDRTLSPAELEQSKAWAHYAHGLLMEAAQGRGTPAALEAFEAARACDPDSRQPTEALALNLLHQSRHPEALAVLAERCRRHPDDPDARLAYARTAEITGSHAEAAEYYGAAFDLRPEFLSPAYDRIRCLFASRQDREALRAMKTLYQRQPATETRLVPVQWASFFLNREQSPLRAIPCLELSAELATNQASRAAYLAFLAETWIMTGQTGTARRVYAQALEADSLCPAALRGLGSLLAGDGDTQAVDRVAARALQRADPLPDSLVAAYAYEVLGARTSVVSVLTAACNALRGRNQRIPESLYLHLGATLDELDRDDQAADVFQEALAAYPQSHTIMNHLAYMRAVNNTHLEDAARLVLSALTLEPENGAYLDTLGWVRYRQGRHAEALTSLLQALLVMGDDPVVLDHVGDAMAALGRLPEAVAYWSRSYGLDANQTGLPEKLRKHGVDPDTIPRLGPQSESADKHPSTSKAPVDDGPFPCHSPMESGTPWRTDRAHQTNRSNSQAPRPGSHAPALRFPRTKAASVMNR